MTQDLEDWYPYAPRGPVYPMQDLGELAIRLGSPVTFDRRGDVVFLDDFESGIAKWAFGTDGEGADYEWSAEAARNGAFSLKLVGGKDEDQYAMAERWLPYLPISKIGVECSFYFDYDTKYFNVVAIQHAGAARYLYACLYDWEDKELQYLNDEGVYIAIATDITLRERYNSFNTVKLVFDMDTKKYVRLILNETEYDLSAYSGRRIGEEVIPYFEIEIINYSRFGFNDALWVDDVIITQNEP